MHDIFWRVIIQPDCSQSPRNCIVAQRLFFFLDAASALTKATHSSVFSLITFIWCHSGERHCKLTICFGIWGNEGKPSKARLLLSAQNVSMEAPGGSELTGPRWNRDPGSPQTNKQPLRQTHRMLTLTSSFPQFTLNIFSIKVKLILNLRENNNEGLRPPLKKKTNKYFRIHL